MWREITPVDEQDRKMTAVIRPKRRTSFEGTTSNDVSYNPWSPR